MNRDILAGGFVILLGAAALLLVSQFPLDGEGPASSSYFPRLVGWAIVVIGVVILLQAVCSKAALPAFHLRPIGMLLSGILAFSVLIGPGGLALASGCCALLGSYAAPFAGLKKRLLTVLVITFLAVLVFKVFLKLNLNVWPEWIS